jgi:urease beta subunit
LITVSGTISANTTWDAANTYQVTSSITLSAGYTLTIPAGTVVKFNPSISMIVYGNLQAVGTPGNEIYFTSRDDDTVGAIATSSDHNPVR